MAANNHILFKKLQNLKYKNRWFIYFSDILMSVFATVISSFFALILLEIEWRSGITMSYLLVSIATSAIFLQLFKIYKIIYTEYDFKYLLKLIGASFCISFSLSATSLLYADTQWTVAFVTYCGLFNFIITILLLVSTRAIFVIIYYVIASKTSIKSKCCLLYSSTTKIDKTFIEQINSNSNSSYYIRGLLTRDFEEKGSKISKRPVFHIGNNDTEMKTLSLLNKLHIKAIIFTDKSSFERERDDLVSLCMLNNIQIFLLDNFNLDSNNHISDKHLRPININDLLERDKIEINMLEIKKELQERVVLVTGAAGAIGSEIVNQLITFDVKHLLLIDNSEILLQRMQVELDQKYPYIKITYQLSDIQIEKSMDIILNTYKPELIFHAAAYKHVSMIENNPCEAVLNNIWGTINVANCAVKYGVKKFILISTDKAINPTNIMGASKRISEMFIQHLNTQSSTQFTSIRFGKLLGRTNSIVTRFEKHIAMGGPIIVKHPETSRFFMSIPEACSLILETSTLGEGGEIFAFDMGKQIKILSLAKKMIYLSGLKPDKDIKILYIGLRPGEKLHEEELALEEKTNSTKHPRIRVTHPVQNNNADMLQNIELLMKMAKEMDTKGTVLQMKKIVPEFISKNSIYEIYDDNYNDTQQKQ